MKRAVLAAAWCGGRRFVPWAACPDGRRTRRTSSTRSGCSPSGRMYVTTRARWMVAPSANHSSRTSGSTAILTRTARSGAASRTTASLARARSSLRTSSTTTISSITQASSSPRAARRRRRRRRKRGRTPASACCRSTLPAASSSSTTTRPITRSVRSAGSSGCSLMHTASRR